MLSGGKGSVPERDARGESPASHLATKTRSRLCKKRKRSKWHLLHFPKSAQLSLRLTVRKGSPPPLLLFLQLHLLQGRRVPRLGGTEATAGKYCKWEGRKSGVQYGTARLKGGWIWERHASLSLSLPRAGWGNTIFQERRRTRWRLRMDRSL